MWIFGWKKRLYSSYFSSHLNSCPCRCKMSSALNTALWGQVNERLLSFCFPVHTKAHWLSLNYVLHYFTLMSELFVNVIQMICWDLVRLGFNVFFCMRISEFIYCKVHWLLKHYSTIRQKAYPWEVLPNTSLFNSEYCWSKLGNFWLNSEITQEMVQSIFTSSDLIVNYGDTFI